MLCILFVCAAAARGAMARGKNNCHRGDPGGKCCIQTTGVVLLALGLSVCVWTEAEYITRSRALREAMAHTEPVPLDELERYYRAHPFEGDGEPRLVHTSGHLQSKWLATDDALGVGVPAVRLRRKVWMYQKWKEKKGGNNSGHRTVVGWKEEAPSDAMLSSSAGNPPMLLRSTTFTARDTRLGPFEVAPELLEQHVTWWQPLPCTTAVANAISQAVSDARAFPNTPRARIVSADVIALVGARGVRADDHNGYCVLSHDPAHVQIGDYRIAFEYAVPTGVRVPLFANPSAVTPLTPEQLAPIQLDLPAVTDFWWRTTVAHDDDRHAVSVLALIEPVHHHASGRRPAAPGGADDDDDDDDANGDGLPDALPVRLSPYHAASSNGVVSFVVSHADGDYANSAAGMFTGAFRLNRLRTFGGRALSFLLLLGHALFNYVDVHWGSGPPWVDAVWHTLKVVHCVLDHTGYGLGALLLAWTWQFGASALVWLLFGRLVGYGALCACAAVLPWLLYRQLNPTALDRLKSD